MIRFVLNDPRHTAPKHHTRIAQIEPLLLLRLQRLHAGNSSYTSFFFRSKYFLYSIAAKIRAATP